MDRKLVVAALAVDQQGRVLLTRRKHDQPMPGLWELPGGKVEFGESPTTAIEREVLEEIGCAAKAGAVYEVIHHAYPHFEVVLLIYRVELLGVPEPRQVAELRWVSPAELTAYDVLQADVEPLARIARAGRVEEARGSTTRASYEALTRDARTAGLNAHVLQLRLDEELARARRYARPLSLLLVDVDDLALVNDRYGRGVGDDVLAQIATLMTQKAREIDRIGRATGSGFALILPETSAGMAYGIAERLRADVAAKRFSPTGRGAERVELRSTVSIGAASTRGSIDGDSGTLVERADAALWRAKLTGRNRTVIDGGIETEAP